MLHTLNIIFNSSLIIHNSNTRLQIYLYVWCDKIYIMTTALEKILSLANDFNDTGCHYDSEAVADESYYECDYPDYEDNC